MFVFKINFEWRGVYGNILSFIPNIILVISKYIEISFRWFGFEFVIQVGKLNSKFKIIYLTPMFSLQILDKKFKEVFDFNFCFGLKGYRKLLGSRKNYTTILSEEIEKFRKSELFSSKVFVVTNNTYPEKVFISKDSATRYCTELNNSNETNTDIIITNIEYQYYGILLYMYILYRHVLCIYD